MSITIRTIERKWIANFKKSALVNKTTGFFESRYAYQLFYGRLDEGYPTRFPCNFTHFYNTCNQFDRDSAIDQLVLYLNFIGIKIRKDAIWGHLEKYPNDFEVLLKKCYYILKTLARHGSALNVSNPYYDNNGDLYFLLRIESEESIHGGQLNLFIDLELPDLYKKITSFPEGYDKDQIVTSLFDRIERSNVSFFITGKAGTGKSTFIHYFAQKTRKKVLLTAFTGIAAINVGGQTLHSFFRFPPKPLMPGDEEIVMFPDYSQRYQIIREMDTLVIDEVSMLRSDILEAIDFSLRNNGGDPDKQFGGKQILFIGDIFQLPPVVDSAAEAEQILFSEIFNSEYFFDSHSYRNNCPEYYEFTRSHRQKDDLPFVRLLDEVRICQASDATLAKLNERYNPDFTPGNEEFAISLTATNIIAHTENVRKLLELQHTQFDFEAEITGEFKEDRYPTGKILSLKKNAQVIFIKNDGSQRRWVNGTIAKIDFLSADLIEVKMQDGTIHKLEKVCWENRKFKYDAANRKIVSEVIGTFTQFPVKLAWAITIHKSQGLTFDRVVIDLGRGAFVNGQLYTALSRCRTLNGIVLKRKLRQEDIIADQRVIDFHQRSGNFGANGD